MNGKKLLTVSFLFLISIFFNACSSKSFIFGSEEGFCQDCNYQYKGVCANPIDIYYNSDLIMEKKTKCDKKETKRKGTRE